MNFLKTEGNTRVILKSKRTRLTILISILSHRAAKLAVKKSMQGKWKRSILPYIRPWECHGFAIIGFQPETGFHIAIKIKNSSTLKS